MATYHKNKEIPKSKSDSDLGAERRATPRIVIQDAYEDFPGRSAEVEAQSPPRPGPTSVDRREWEPDSWSYNGSGSDGLEPVWAGSVQPSGELFYLEPGQSPQHRDHLNSSHTLHQQAQPDRSSQTAVKKKKNLAALQKLMRRKKNPELMNVNNSADSSSKSITKQRIGVNRQSPRRTSIQKTRLDQTKEVTLKVDGRQTQGSTYTDKLELLLGIICASDRKSVIGNGTAQNGSAQGRKRDKRPPSGDTRVAVRGLIPSGAAMKSGEIEPGDIIVGINGIPVSTDTLDSVLTSMANVSVFKLHIQRGGLGSWEKYIMPPQRPAINGTLVKLISGERLKETEDPLRDVCHIVTYLTLGNPEDEEGKDILYEFPLSRASRKLSNIRGLFITLSDMLQNITDSAITSTSLVIGNEVIHIGYHKSGAEVLVMAVPASKVQMFLLDCIVKDVARLLCFLFRNLDGAFHDSNHQRLNHLFSLLFQRLLLPDNQQSQRNNSNTFLEGLPGVRWLDLPEEVKLNIDSNLSELEAADFADMSDDHYEDRRPYVLLGSCLFYKGYVIASHLPADDLRDVCVYCRNYSLMVLSSRQPVGQLVIWKEVYPTRRTERREPVVQGYQEPEGRWFMLIVGQRHSLLCLLLEAGGCAAQCEGNPAPDPFYVDQARATVLHLESLNVPIACEERLSAPPIPALSCADWFFPSRKTIAESGTPPLPIQASPMLSRLHSQSPARGRKLFQGDPTTTRHRSRSPTPHQLPAPSPRLRRHTSPRLDSDNDSDTATSPLNSRTNSTQSSPQTYRRNDNRKGSDVSGGSVSSTDLYKVARKKRLIPDPYSMGMMHQGREEQQCNDYFTATKLTAGCDNTLFHYVHLDSARGIIVCPTHGDLSLISGSSHNQLIDNFNRCCVAIRMVLCRSAKFKAKPEEPTQSMQADHSLGYVREHGIMFRCQPENWPEQKKAPPSFNYWVVGRLFEEPHPRECYVCYHESTTQNVIELAFKLSFGAGL